MKRRAQINLPSWCGDRASGLGAVDKSSALVTSSPGSGHNFASALLPTQTPTLSPSLAPLLSASLPSHAGFPRNEFTSRQLPWTVSHKHTADALADIMC